MERVGGLLLRLWNRVLDHELEVALSSESARLKLRALASTITGVLRSEDTLSVLDVLLDGEVSLSEGTR